MICRRMELIKNPFFRFFNKAKAANLHIGRKVRGANFMMEHFIADNPEKVLSIGTLPRKRRRKSEQYDYTVIAGKASYLSPEILNAYHCK